MALAKPFQFLNKQTNVPLADFSKVTSNQVLNQDYSNVSPQVSALSSGISAGLPTSYNLTNLTPIKLTSVNLGNGNALLNNIRSASQNVFQQGKMLGECGCANNYIPTPSPTAEAGMYSMFNNNSGMLSIISSLSQNCLNSLINALDQSCNFSQTINGVPITPQQAAENCALTSLSALLNELTGGAFSPVLGDPCSSYRQLVGLSVASANSGMYGSFGALANTITDQNVINIGGATVMKNAAMSGDYNLMSDVAGSSAGPNIISLIPGIAALVGASFAIPPNTQQSGYSSLANNFDSMQTSLDGNFNVAAQNGSSIPSIRSIAGNNQVASIYGARTQSNRIDVQALLGNPTGYQGNYSNQDHAFVALAGNNGLADQDINQAATAS